MYSPVSAKMLLAQAAQRLIQGISLSLASRISISPFKHTASISKAFLASLYHLPSIADLKDLPNLSTCVLSGGVIVCILGVQIKPEPVKFIQALK